MKEYCRKYNEEVVKRNLVLNEEGFNTYTFYNWTEEENEGFCKMYLEEVCNKAKVREKAAEVISKLKENNEIYIMSTRIKRHFSDPVKVTEKFLNENNIVYNKIIVNHLDRYSACIENGIDIMIEDEPRKYN